VISAEVTDTPIYGGNGVNGYANKALYDNPVVVVGRVGQQCGVVHRTNGPSWVTDNAIVVKSIDENMLDSIYLAYAFQMAPIRDTVTRLDLPFINQKMLKTQQIPLPPIGDQKLFRKLHTHTLGLGTVATKTFDESNNLFNSLVQRAFRGEL